MTLDDIIRMGYEAGLCDDHGCSDQYGGVYIANHLMQFAILVLTRSLATGEQK